MRLSNPHLKRTDRTKHMDVVKGTEERVFCLLQTDMDCCGLYACNRLMFNYMETKQTSQVTYVTMVPRVGNETLRPLGDTMGNASSVTRA